MTAFKGTWRLLRLALRLDRVKLPLWILAIIGIMASSAFALGDLYNSTEALIAYASTTAPSVIGRAFGGLIDGPTLGAVTMVELFNFTAILMAFMSTLAVVRHTRHSEESGAAELVSSGIVGRYASLAAAVLVASGANIIVGASTFFILAQVESLSISGALGMSLALTMTGIAFAGIAAIGAQISETARGANSIAGASIGIAFLLRAIGDGFGSVSADGLRASAGWPSWLSPFGWGFQVHPFTQQNWWLLGLLAVFMGAMIAGSFWLLARRDVGLGILPARTGRALAKPGLLSPIGLAWRLQRGTLIGWGIGFIVFGIIIGGMANEFSELFGANEEAAEILATLGGSSENLTDVFFGAMFGFAGITVTGYGLQSILKLRGEEVSGHLEPILGTAVGRIGWAFSHMFITLLGVSLLIITVGITAAITHVIFSGGPWSEIWRLLPAALVQLPAVLAFLGVVMAVFGAFPRLTVAFAWSAFAGSFLIFQLAALLKLPGWTINVSPFTHVPSVPAEAIAFTPIAIMLSLAVGFTVFGCHTFARRDLATP